MISRYCSKNDLIHLFYFMVKCSLIRGELRTSNSFFFKYYLKTMRPSLLIVAHTNFTIYYFVVQFFWMNGLIYVTLKPLSATYILIS